MAFKVVASTVGNSYTLNPTVAAFNFSIPAIHGVVCHFVLLMLTESEAFGVNADVGEELPRDAHEFRYGCVANESLLTCFT